MMRLLVIGLAAMMLSGCNILISDKPMFTAADAAKAPVMRPGLWVQKKPDCPFDETSKADTWPRCADPMIFEADRMVDPNKPGDDIPYILAAGNPRVLQAQSKVEPLVGYLFVAVDPVRSDKEGRILEARSWLAQCGPPPVRETGDTHSAGRTTTSPQPETFTTPAPFPGLTVDPQTSNCTPKDAAAVRRAVVGSEALSNDIAVIRWVRDGKD